VDPNPTKMSSDPQYCSENLYLCPVFYFKLKFEEEKTLIKGMMHWNLSPASRDVNHTIKRSQKYLPNEI
jgi:hypothetical protein